MSQFGEDMPTDPGAHARDPTQRVAGRYIVDRLIARGGMAAVYLAEHADLRRPVALKILRPPDEADGAVDFEDRFRLEAQTLAQLNHPNIVTLHDFGRMEDGRVFLAMEYIDGPRLTDLLKAGPIDPHRAIGLILQVCQALRYAHARGVIHRDLKPSNLLVLQESAEREIVKVVDFGLVKLTHDDQSVTKAGLVLGSPHCMSPEQVKGLDVDARTDVYAIGVLLFRALMGRYPFHGRNSTQTMLAHLNEAVPTFFATNKDVIVPSGLEEVTRCCLEKDPARRYQDMDGLITALAQVIDQPADTWLTSSVAVSTIRRAAPVSPAQSAARMAAAVGFGVVLGLGGIGAVWALTGASMSSSSPPDLAAAAPSAEASPAAVPSPPEPAAGGSAEAPAPGAAEPPAPEPGRAQASEAPAEPAREPARTESRRERTPSRRSTSDKPARTEQARPAPRPAPRPEPAAEAPEGYRGLPEDF